MKPQQQQKKTRRNKKLGGKGIGAVALHSTAQDISEFVSGESTFYDMGILSKCVPTYNRCPESDREEENVRMRTMKCVSWRARERERVLENIKSEIAYRNGRNVVITALGRSISLYEPFGSFTYYVHPHMNDIK